MATKGSCLCGAVTYEIAGALGRTGHCHCSKCRKSHGAGKVTEVVLGTIDGDPGVRPGEHIFVGSGAPWYEIADAFPQFEAWPPDLKT